MANDYNRWRTATPYDYEIADEELEDIDFNVDASFLKRKMKRFVLSSPLNSTKEKMNDLGCHKTQLSTDGGESSD